MPFPHSTLESALPSYIHFMNSQSLRNLDRKIEATLKEPYPEPWLPDLTAPLALGMAGITPQHGHNGC